MPGESVLKYVSPGEPVSATQWNNLIRFLRSLTTLPGLFVDGTGVYQRRMRERAAAISSGTNLHWGELITDLKVRGTCMIQEYTQDALGSWCIAGAVFATGEHVTKKSLVGFYGLPRLIRPRQILPHPSVLDETEVLGLKVAVLGQVLFHGIRLPFSISDTHFSAIIAVSPCGVSGRYKARTCDLQLVELIHGFL